MYKRERGEMDGACSRDLKPASQSIFSSFSLSLRFFSFFRLPLPHVALLLLFSCLV
jgi:hypothetical protein